MRAVLALASPISRGRSRARPNGHAVRYSLTYVTFCHLTSRSAQNATRHRTLQPSQGSDQDRRALQRSAFVGRSVCQRRLSCPRVSALPRILFSTPTHPLLCQARPTMLGLMTAHVEMRLVLSRALVSVRLFVCSAGLSAPHGSRASVLLRSHVPLTLCGRS